MNYFISAMYLLNNLLWFRWSKREENTLTEFCSLWERRTKSEPHVMSYYNFPSSHVPREAQAPRTYRQSAGNCRRWAIPVLGAWCTPCLGSVLSAPLCSKQAVPMLPLSRLPSSSLDALYIELQCPPSFPQLAEIVTAEYPPNRISSLSSSTHLKAT